MTRWAIPAILIGFLFILSLMSTVDAADARQHEPGPQSGSVGAGAVELHQNPAGMENLAVEALPPDPVAEAVGVR